MNGKDYFKIIRYFNRDYYGGFNVGDIITSENVTYVYFNYHDKDNYIKFGH